MSSHRIEHALIQQADQNPQRTAVVAGADSFTYVEVLQQARHMAGRLQRAGIKPGDRVAIYLDKTPKSVAALYGGWLAGAIVVPINTTLRSPQVRHILSDSGAAVVVSRRSLLRRGAQEAVSDITVVDVDDAPHPGVDPADASGASDALAVAQPDLSGGDTPAAILYTSGSTGQPKGILIAHDNLVAGARIVSTYLRIRADDRLLSVVPFNFDYGLNQLLVAFREGSALVLQRSTLPADICRTLVDAEVSVMAAVPPLWVQLMTERSPFSQTPFPKLRLLTSTGGVFPRALIEKYRRRLPDAELIIMYGLSEAFRSTYLPFDQIDARPGSMGHAIPETEI
ncbi:MAG: AMP-binding protein, partial [Myxococcota bacterium]